MKFHSAPFSKTQKGRRRREERLFVKEHMFDELKPVTDDGRNEHNRSREDYWRIREDRQLITNMMRKAGWL